MTYFKIIENGQAVDAGWMWLKWNPKHKCLMVCEPREAQYAQSYKETAIYHFGWLNPLPDGAPVYPTAEGAIIDPDEYNDLVEILDDGETVLEPVEPDEPGGGEGQESEPGEPEPEDKPMTVAQMRQKIAELEAAVLNASTPFPAPKTYQTDEIITKGSRVYIANQVIVKGETVTPGINCTETSVEQVLNALQAQQ